MAVILELFNLLATMCLLAVVWRRRHLYVTKNAKSATLIFLAVYVVLRIAHFLPEFGVSAEASRDVQAAIGTMATTALVLVFGTAPPGLETRDIVTLIRRPLATNPPQVSSTDVTQGAAKAQEAELCST